MLRRRDAESQVTRSPTNGLKGHYFAKGYYSGMIGDSTKRSITKLAGLHEPIVKNALRLFDDAQLLRKAHRYPSCAALAILSLEELGKFLGEREEFIDRSSPKHKLGQNRLYSHKQKQQLAAKALVGILGIDEIRGLVAAKGYTLEVVPIGQASGPTVLELISSIDETAYAKKIENKVRNSKNHRFLIDFAKGTFDTLKQKAFYVDRNGNGALSEPARNIDRLTADKLLRLSSAAIYATATLLRRLSNKST
jgi:AbiV family abortive infection protein